MKPALSIVIPTYNRGHTLVKVLDALEAQAEALQDAEVLVIDDGSRDATTALVQPYIVRQRLQLQYLPDQNGGASVARNRGLRAARGSLVLFLDCDILPSAQLVTEHRRFHARFPEPSYALRGSVVMAPAGPASVRRVEFHSLGGAEGFAPLPWHAFRSGNISLKRAFLLQHGLFDPQLRTQEDTELGYRLGKQGLRLFHSDAAVGYHEHPMEVQEYWRYGAQYGRSMALWHAKYPDLLADLTAAGIEHKYGLVSWRSAPSRIVKHYAKALLANRLTIGPLLRGSQALRARHARWAERVNRLGYYYHFKRSFKQHRRLIQAGLLIARRPLRVCMLAAPLPPEYSGAARQALTLAQALRERGDVDVAFLSWTRHKELAGRQCLEGLPVHRIYTPSLSWAAKAALSLKIAAWLWRERRRYDVWHLHGGGFLADGPTLLGRVLGKKTVLKMTTWGEDDAHAIRTGRLHWLKYPLFLLADHYVAPSAPLGQGLRAGKLSTIPNAVDVARFYPADEAARTALRRRLGLPLARPLAITVGPMIARKRLALLVQLWRQVVDRVPEALLLHLGPAQAEPAYAAEVAEQVRRLHLTPHVQFLGLREDLEAYLRAADIFLFASEREGSPNAVAEAMAAGLPCVVFAIPGITDELLTHARDGVVVDPQEPEAFVRQAALLLGNAQERQRLGQEARERMMASRDVSVISDRYAALYRQLLTDTGDPHALAAQAAPG